MSPEQCRGVNVEKGTDIYALGMILYEMFAGRLPFQGSFAELITHHLMTVPEPPSRHRPMPRALDS
jgi:serine/threonine-protein kinase